MAEQVSGAPEHVFKMKFSLLELLIILMLVGLFFLFFVPVNQAKINRGRVEGAISTIQMIGDKAEQFKANPDNGYYPDISQLNLGHEIDSRYFKYQINTDDSTIVATTLPPYGKKDASIVYNLAGKQFRIGKDDNDFYSKKAINENWLP